MSNERGFTLMEMIVAIVVLGVGIAGVMSAFSIAARGSGDPMVRQQLLAIAEEMMEEVQLKPFAVAANGAPAGCARDTFNDIWDYNGYSQLCTVDGTTITALSGYTISVTVAGAALGAVPATDAARIRIAVARGTETLALVGWRTRY